MPDLKGARVGCAMTGSFCTFSKAFRAFEALRAAGAELFPIMSDNAYAPRHALWQRCGHARAPARNLRPRNLAHIAGCGAHRPEKNCSTSCSSPPARATRWQTGARSLRHGGGHGGQNRTLRNGGNVLLAVSTNDGLGRSAANIGALLAMKHIFFAPFRQDDFTAKPDSLVADFALIPEAAEAALRGKTDATAAPARPVQRGKDVNIPNT